MASSASRRLGMYTKAKRFFISTRSTCPAPAPPRAPPPARWHGRRFQRGGGAAGLGGRQVRRSHDGPYTRARCAARVLT